MIRVTSIVVVVVFVILVLNAPLYANDATTLPSSTDTQQSICAHQSQKNDANKSFVDNSEGFTPNISAQIYTLFKTDKSFKVANAGIACGKAKAPVCNGDCSTGSCSIDYDADGNKICTCQ